MFIPAARPDLRAAILADTLVEADAVCHQNIADNLADLVATAGRHWCRSPAAFTALEPPASLVFASIADVLADLFEGLSSGQLQALYAVRQTRP
jgi:hypothetical protein